MEEFWNEFRRVTIPAIAPGLVLAGRTAQIQQLEKWESTGSLVVRVLADSTDEAIAFWAATIARADSELLACTVVVSDAERVREMMSASRPLTFVWKLDDPSLLTAVIERGHRVFVPLSKSTGANSTADIELPRLKRGDFIAAIKQSLPREPGESEDPERERMADMRREDQAYKLWDQSGPSLTVYRRLFAAYGVSSIPQWAESQTGVVLLPVLLAENWSENNDADRMALARLANAEYDSVNRLIAIWQNRPDSPVRKIGRNWTLAAPLDSWSSLAGLLTDPVLERFAEVALDVLSEPDPALELPPEVRWLAGFPDPDAKRPVYSSELRDGLSHSLILLAVVGKAADAHLTVSAADCSSGIVRRLLGKGVGSVRWSSLYRQLPLLAEAAPEAFLDAVEDELRCDPPALQALFEPEERPLGGGGRYPHLLWALELLAWDPEQLPGVTRILGRLDRIAPKGKLVNSTLKSLQSIFCTWHRNTAASLNTRFDCIDWLIEQEAETAWKLALALLPTNSVAVSSNNREPRWRDKSEVEPPTYGEIWQANEGLTVRALRVAGCHAERLEELIHKAAHWPSQYRSRLVDQIREFAETNDNVDEKVKMWNTIRDFVALHRSFRDAEWALAEADVLPFEQLLCLLAPEFPKQYVWLFNSEYPQLTRPTAADHQERDREAEVERQLVIRSIFQERGLPGLLALAASVGHPGPSIIGRTLAQVIDEGGDWREVMELTLGSEVDATRKLGIGFVYRLWHRFGNPWVSDIVLSANFRTWHAAKASDFCLSLPSDRSTWEIVETLSREAQAIYWKRVYVFLTPATDRSDADYGIRKMIESGRSYDALHFAGSYPAMFETDLLIKVLNKVFDALCRASEPIRDPMLSQYLQRILERLREADDVSEEIIGVLEWKLLPALQFDYAPAALNRRLQRDPSFFAGVVRCIFQGEEESAEEAESEPLSELESRRANFAWKLLSRWRLSPGVRDDRSLDGAALSAWFRTARAACAERKVREVGDIEIGKILAWVPAGEDQVWPPRDVRSLIEEADSEALESGIHSGRINMRGVHAYSPFEGGRAEREFVKKYRGWEKAVSARWPRTRRVLHNIAETYESMAKHHDISSEALEVRR